MASTLNGTAERREALRERHIAAFWERVKAPEGCLLYYGAKEANGYGYVKNPMSDSPKYLTAHRLAWILKRGPIPTGMQVLHLCDMRACCNVEHLFLGTIKENMKDMKRKGKTAAGERCIHAKLTDDDVRAIYAQKPKPHSKNGLAVRLAKQHGVKEGAIHSIWRGAYWKHITAPHQASVSNRRP